jgi:hypothetical protein
MAPIPAGLVAPLADTNVAVAIGKYGRANAIKCPSSGYLVAAHTVERPDNALTVNFAPATILRVEHVVIEPGWIDGWAQVAVDPEYETVGGTSIEWAPERRVVSGEPVYVVIHPNAANEQLGRASPLDQLDSVIVTGRVVRSDDQIVFMSIPSGVSLLGLSGGACLMWDDASRSLVLVGLFCGVSSSGEGVIVRTKIADSPPHE